MDQLTPYRDDVYAWSREQAAVLRDMMARRDLPNQLDLENVAEEIESVGSEVRNAVQSFIRLILLHLVKATVSPAQDPQAHWRSETIGFHAEILGRYTRSMRKDLDLDLAWRLALRQARALSVEGGEPFPDRISPECPIDLARLVADDLDYDGLLLTVRAALEHGRTGT